MDDVIRALCKTVNEYHELHSKCWGASPMECKELMTMGFPVIQGFSMQHVIRDIGALPYDNSKVGEYLKEYKTSHNNKYAVALGVINEFKVDKSACGVKLSEWLKKRLNSTS